MKTIKQILQSLFLIASLILLSSCGGDGIGGTGIQPDDGVAPNSITTENTILRVTIPFREHGYSNFETSVIHSQAEFNEFISDVNEQSAWNNKADFLQQIQLPVINYDTENLILFRITEPSGSIILTPQAPVVENNKIIVVINRQVPEIGTSDIANYALAYKVDKTITEILFKNGAAQTLIDLTESITAVQSKLIRSNEETLLAYFQDAIKRSNSFDSDSINVEFSSLPAVTANSSSGNTGFSTTNIQELGVDEADLIKTNGRYLYTVKKPNSFGPVTNTGIEPNVSQSFAPENTQVSSDIIRIMDTQGVQGLIEIKSLSDTDKPWNITGLYLHEDQKRLIALSSKKQNYYTHWFDSSYFAHQETDVLFVDINNPSNASVTTKLSFEGQLIDSRRNGNTLYMVLRHYPAYQYTDDVALATTNNEDFLPSFRIGVNESQPIVAPENCYLGNGQQGSTDIITLIAVDLTSESPQINSQCYVGSAEAIYASQNALYLATTRWDYQALSGVAEYNNQITTDIHKFSYDGLAFDYRGSGEVDGHLGFRQDSKSFRFSEYEGFLRVVTFDEDQWAVPFVSLPVEPLDSDAPPPISTGTETSQPAPATEIIAQSPVSVSILKENTSNKSLQLVSKLPNADHPEPIGLPGEQLYASRFIGNRAYIVTFRVTDPLYVIDLSDATDPKIAGELKIDGYSEYLHPISENLLLGVGKDAVPAQIGGFGGDGRGAWYQGVKLSLVDISDPANPREADKVILGKRGTESTALYTHHGLTGLRVNDKYRVAIPVQLHSSQPQFTSSPEAANFYSHTNTGLYRFEVDINSQQIEQIPALIVNVNANGSNRNVFNDRSVIINDDVFYMHNGDLWTQDWQGSNPVIGPK